MPPAFTLSQDQTLRFFRRHVSQRSNSAPITQPITLTNPSPSGHPSPHSPQHPTPTAPQHSHAKNTTRTKHQEAGCQNRATNYSNFPQPINSLKEQDPHPGPETQPGAPPHHCEEWITAFRRGDVPTGFRRGVQPRFSANQAGSVGLRSGGAAFTGGASRSQHTPAIEVSWLPSPATH